MTEPLCPHGHPAYGCPDARIEWDPLTVDELEEPVPPLNVRRDATLILLAFLGMACIAVIAWSAR